MSASQSSSSGSKGDYTFYDENYKPMFKRGISRKIGESAFVQQTLPTYRLSWSPVKICPILLLMGALFIGMGFGIKKFADGIQEVKIRYTNCSSVERPGQTCYKILEKGNDANTTGKIHPSFVDAIDVENCTCNVNFQLKEPLKKTVYIYYSLINFYQNHLKCYQSRDENQLKGKLFDGETVKEPSSLCKKLAKNDGKVIYPCGVMANGMFTDVIQLIYHPPPADIQFKMNGPPEQGHHHQTDDEYGREREEDIYRNGNNDKLLLADSIPFKVPLIKTGIAWDSDWEDKYQHPDIIYNASDPHPVWDKISKPYRWKRSVWQLDPHNLTNNGVKNEDFIVWMRAAAFPWFRKLYRIVDSKNEPFKNGLPAGNYTFNIQYDYDVSAFKGEKEIILTTSSMVAGKNMFLAIVYMATGGVCVFLSFVLFVAYIFFGRKLKVNPELFSKKESIKKID